MDDSRAVVVSDGYAYVAGGERGLQILDISDPAAMTMVWSAPVD
jgi:hypothetical protein